MIILQIVRTVFAPDYIAGLEPLIKNVKMVQAGCYRVGTSEENSVRLMLDCGVGTHGENCERVPLVKFVNMIYVNGWRVSRVTLMKILKIVNMIEK